LPVEQDGALSARALILVADPDPHVQRLERYFLESAGFDVEIVPDGEAGLERARARRPVILVTELLLPKKDGLSVCRALKSDPLTRAIRVLVFSILAAEDRARHAGADAFLRKPLDDAQLLHTVETLLQSRGKEG
jgi:CheY-like chemotaxis protein